MGRLERGALAALAAIVLGSCGSDRVTTVDGAVEVDPRSVDFGRVALGVTAQREIKVRNLGRGPLGVKDLAIPGLGKDMAISGSKNTIGSGQSMSLQLRYSPQQEEVLSRTLEVSVDDPKQRMVGVTVQGLAVKPRVVPDPLLLDFGRIELGDRRELPLTLINAFDVQVDARLTQTGDPAFGISQNQVSVAPGTRVQVTASFAPAALGPVTALVQIVPCPSCDVLVVALKGTGIAHALVVEPDPVDFGTVPIDRSSTLTVTLRNDGSLPLRIDSIADAPGGADEAAFTLVPPQTPVTLGEGETVTFQASFAASRLGKNEDTFQVASSSHTSPNTQVVMTGTGGGPEVRVDPVLSFGRVPVGARAYADLRIDNVGADPPQLLIPPVPGLLGVEVTGGAPLFGIEVPPLPLSIPADQSALVRIYFEPTAVGEGDGEATIRTNDGSQREVKVRLVGHAYMAGLCTMHVSPVELDFGSIDVGHEAALGYRIYNDGAEPCIVRHIDLAAGSDPAFMLPGGPIESWVAAPYTDGAQMVGFDPAKVGAGTGVYRGTLHMTVVNAANPDVTIPLLAISETGCLGADPLYLDFGVRERGCGASHRTVHITNRCTGPIDAGPITIGPQSVDKDFEITGAPATPLTLNTGDGFDVDVAWNALLPGQTFAPLFIGEPGRSAPMLVPLYAETAQTGTTTDRFVQHTPKAADILIVVDNSSSMLEEQGRAAQSVGALITEAQRQGIDFHVGVTTTGLTPAAGPPACPGGAEGGEAGRLFPVDNGRPRIVTSTTVDPVGTLQASVQVGQCHNLEEGLEAMRLALSEPLVSSIDDPITPQPADGNAGFLRTGAQLSVVFISDEDDHSGALVSDYVTFLDRLKGQGGAVVSAIVDTDAGTCPDASGVGTRYMEVVKATGGESLPICAPDFSKVFRDVADRSFQPRTTFTLSRTPDGPAGLTVQVDGRPVAAGAFTYDAGNNAISFPAGSEPAPGAEIDVTYSAGCK